MPKSDPDNTASYNVATLSLKTLITLFLVNLLILIILLSIESYADSKITAESLKEYKNTHKLLQSDLNKIDSKLNKLNIDMANLQYTLNKLKETSKPPKRKFERRM